MLKEILRYSEEKLFQTKNFIPSEGAFKCEDDGIKMFVDTQGLRNQPSLELRFVQR